MRSARPAILPALVLPLFLIGCGDGPTAGPGSHDAAVVEDHHVPAHVVPSGQFVAPLSGAEEVPAVETRARGQAKFGLSRDGTELSYRLIVANIENVLMAHIHLAPAGENGGVVVWLYPEDGPPAELVEGRFDGVLATGVITEDDLVVRWPKAPSRT